MPFDRASRKDEITWRQVLTDRRFSRLEAIADELRRTNAKYCDGRSRLWRSYGGLAEFLNHTETEAGYQERIALLEDWIKEIPKTVTGRTSLSRAWFNYAYFARGGNFATETEEANLRKFSGRCQRGSELLDESDKISPTPDIGYYRMRIELSKGLGTKPDRNLAYAMLKIDPLSREAVAGMTMSLLPRWYGEPGELEQFADEIVRRTKESGGGEFLYAIIGSIVEEFEWDLTFYSHHLEWPRLKQGFRDLERLYSQAREHLEAYFRLAVFANDFEVARKIRESNPQLMAEWNENLAPDIQQGDHQKLIVAHHSLTTTLELLDKGKRVLSADESPSIRIHHLASGKLQIANRLYQADRSSVSACASKNLVAFGAREKPGVDVLRLSDGQSVLVPHDKVVKLTQFSIDGKRLAFVDDGGAILLIDLKSGKQIRSIRDVKGAPAQVMQFSVDGKLLAVITDAGLIQIIGTNEDQDLRDWNIGRSNLRSLAWSPLGDLLAIGDRDGRVTIFQWPDRKLLKSWQADQTIVESLEFSPNERHLAIGLCAHNASARIADPLRLLRVAGDEPPKLLRGHKMGVRKIHFFPDGKQMLTASDDWTIRTWNLEQVLSNQ